MQIAIYGYFIDRICHYAGQSAEPRKRYYHLKSRKFQVPFTMRILRTVNGVMEAARIESQVIHAYKRKGQCQLNKITKPLRSVNLGTVKRRPIIRKAALVNKWDLIRQLDLERDEIVRKAQALLNKPN